jgi:yecA family protein
MGRYNEIATGFNADPERFEPIFWKRPTGEMIVMNWAAGFLDVVEMRRASWEPLFSHRKAKLLIEPLLILGDDGEFDDDRDPDDRWKEFYASRPDVIPNCVLGIYHFWNDYMQRRKPQPRRDRGRRR